MTRNNIYNRPENRNRRAEQSLVKRDLQQARETRGVANNVFADRDGNVSRVQDGKWQSRENGAWKDDPRLNQPVTAEQRDRAREASQNVTPEQRDKLAQAGSKATPQQREKAAAAAKDRGLTQGQPASRPATKPVSKPATTPTTRPASKPASRPTSKPSTYNRSTDLNRAHQARQSGAAREHRAAPARGRGGRRR